MKDIGTMVWCPPDKQLCVHADKAKRAVEDGRIQTLLIIAKEGEGVKVARALGARELMNFRKGIVRESPCRTWINCEAKKLNEGTLYLLVMGHGSIPNNQRVTREDVKRTLHEWEKKGAKVKWEAWEAALDDLAGSATDTANGWLNWTMQRIRTSRRDSRSFYGKWDPELEGDLKGSGLCGKAWKVTKDVITKITVETILRAREICRPELERQSKRT